MYKLKKKCPKIYGRREGNANLFMCLSLIRKLNMKGAADTHVSQEAGYGKESKIVVIVVESQCVRSMCQSGLSMNLEKGRHAQ